MTGQPIPNASALLRDCAGFPHVWNALGRCDFCGLKAPEKPLTLPPLVRCPDCGKLTADRLADAFHPPKPTICPACERRHWARVKAYRSDLDDTEQADVEERLDLCDGFGRLGED